MERKEFIGVGNHIIVKPISTSKLLIGEETATSFEVLSCGNAAESQANYEIDVGSEILVTPGSVTKLADGNSYVYYVNIQDVVAVMRYYSGEKDLVPDFIEK